MDRKAGDADQITRDYYDSLLVELRHLDAVKPDTTLELYGHTFATPVMMAALSHLKGKGGEGDGMVQMAQGAAARNAVNWAGMGDEAQLDAILATGAKTIKIVKPYADRERVYRKIAHAEKNSALAVGIDIDHAFGGSGDYDLVLGHPMRPVTTAELKDFVKATRLPFVIKGVLSVQDAVKCAEAGVQGIVVSHHHSILPYAVPPLLVLPEIVKAIGGRLPIFVDCSVARGMDVFKALALGATAVSAGRVVMGPLREEGAEGVSRVIDEMTRELAGAMARTCSPDIRHIDASLLHSLR